MKRLVLLLLFSGSIQAYAQQHVFTQDDLLAVLTKFHPVARQAAIDVRIAKAGIQSARGGFDPLLKHEAAQKEFGSITYYNQQSTTIEVPTWYGIDLVAGTESLTGSRLNPEETRGSITHMGFSVQPLQNLVMDKRRAALVQARNYHQLSEVQRRIIENDLLQEALDAYWNWWEKYHVQQLVMAALSNAEKRLGFVKTSVQLGDRPAIDTLEAYTQVQAWQIKLTETYQELVKAKLQLSTYLWTENGGHTQLPNNVVPQEYEGEEGSALIDFTNGVLSHPEVKLFDYNMKALQVDKKLAFQALLPDVKIKYNQIGYDLSKTVNAPWFNNNYRYGVSFSIPLRLSEARAGYQKTKLQLENTQLEMANKQVQLHTKVNQYYTEWQQTQIQLSLQENLLANTSILQRAEEMRFSNGESSLFLINAREQKTIEAQQKLIELKSKVQKAAISMKWSAGMLVP